MDLRMHRPDWFVRKGRGGRASALLPVTALLVVVAGTLTSCLGTPSFDKGGPPPQAFTWHEEATASGMTPQEAYAAAMRLTPCIGAPSSAPGLGGPARSVTVAWIVATPNYGLARIQPVCDPPARQYHLWLFELYHDSAQHWRPEGGFVAFNWSAKSDVTPPVPAWLPLPDDMYAQHIVEQPVARSPAISLVSWDARTRLFVFGHIADQALRPVDATTVVVDGYRGWMTTENGLVTVTAALADGTTLFFGGTAAPAEVQSLAADAFAHVDEALSALLYPTVTPSTESGLGN